jgi:hypothetical protein
MLLTVTLAYGMHVVSCQNKLTARIVSLKSVWHL